MSRIVIIGAGSYTWGPIFLRDIFVEPALKGSTIVLHDIDLPRLDLIYRLGAKMLADFDLEYHLEQQPDLEQALREAEFIILTISTGGLDSMRHDLEIPWRYGIRQAVGDTVGPGGISRALRNVPVLDALAQKVVEHCPQALFLNYSNPLSVLTRTLAMRGVRVVGLCHEFVAVRRKLAGLFGVAPEQIEAQVAGINHLAWITGLQAAGQDAWKELVGIAAKVLSGEVLVDAEDASIFADHFRVKARLLQLYGALPAAGDRHIAEFFPYFLNPETAWGERYGLRLTRIEDRQVRMDAARALVEAALAGKVPLEPFMAEPSGEAAAQIFAAVTSGGSYTGIMNLPNGGMVPGLPATAILEAFGTIDRIGMRLRPFGGFPPGVEAVLAHHVANQELTLQAALQGSRKLALQAMLNDPLVSRLEVDRIEPMLEELLEANREWLPRFF